VSWVFDSRFLISLVLLSGAGVSWWLMRGLEGRQAPIPEQVRHIPDYSLDHFTMNVMDATGQLRYRLHADRMSHYLDDDTAILGRPEVTLFKRTGGAWNVSARRGWIGAGQKSVLLEDEVLAWRDPLVPGAGLEIRTDKLHIATERQYAETDQPVTITQDIGVTHAVGMHVDLEHNNVELLRAVRGRYTLN
jgi:lipopolysaccharide export system protein LptC